MQPISRRNALVLGGLGLAGTAIGGTGLLLGWTSRFGSVSGARFAGPSELRSTDGLLQVDLTAAPGKVQVAGGAATVLSYNGGLPGPTLRVRAGDRLRVTLHNQLHDPTNLHVHGLHVSPQGNGDNMFVSVDPGTSFHYEYQLPEGHPPGVYWYHPHHHGLVAQQVFGGLYGAIIVEDSEPIPVARDRVMVISDITLDAAGRIPVASAMTAMMGREGALILVNGRINPRLSARPGERERWRIVNACSARYLRLRLDGHQVQLLGIDSGRFQTPKNVGEVLLTPGNRADLLVTASAGKSALRLLPFDRGGASGMMGAADSGDRSQNPPSATAASLATLAVAGNPAATPAPISTQLPPRDLRTVAVAVERELVFAMGMGMGTGDSMMSFTVDGKVFDAQRTDTVVRAGTVEEWTLTNSSPMDHPIHLHVWPMQIVEENGRDTESVRWQDVVNVPARGRVRVRVAFDDFIGRSVYHCHILDHEDRGMMGVIEVR
ncbi:MAG: multicopper oxidase family protein [Terrimesophilobacter sp.]